jgi:hypothetical protein
MDKLRLYFPDAAAWLGSRLKIGVSVFRHWLGAASVAIWAWLKALSADTWRLVGIAVTIFLLLYYPLGMALSHKIDDNPKLPVGLGGASAPSSLSVAVVAALIDREVNTNGWVMNDPFFIPSSLLDNMPNFQQGMFSSFSRYAIELRDQIGRSRGSSAADDDLEMAAGLLPYPGDVWIFNFSLSLLPTASAERQYLKAREALISYNQRLAAGDAIFERRSDNLLATLDRIALDLGASSAAIEQHVRDHSNDWLDTEGDDLFYNIKGQAYGYFMILTALREDFGVVISDRELAAVWDHMLGSLLAILELDPLVVSNGSPDDLYPANHLLAEGFYLMRARTQMREITNILLK